MNFLKWTIKDEYDTGKKRDTFSGNFLYEYLNTSLELFMRNNFPDEDMNIVSVSRGYPSVYWAPDTDIFYLFKEHVIAGLQEKKYFLLIDNSLEGHSEIEVPIIRSLYYSCEKYNIDPSVVFLIDGNLRSEVYNEIYLDIKGISKPINIISVNGCESQVIMSGNIQNIITSRARCLNENSEKILLSLSRRSRQFRLLAQYILSNKDWKNLIILSQDRIDENFLLSSKFFDFFNEIDYSKSTEWVNSLPILADNTNFSYNYAGDLNSDLYDKTIFSLILETHQHSTSGSSLFYSEKAFKPILCHQPLIIYGQYGCNYGLKEFGYRTYEKYFNLDEIDFEVNPIKRLVKISDELDRIVNYLKPLSRDKQIEWRFSHQDILVYNKEHYLKKKYFRNKLSQMIQTMKSIKNGENKLHWKNI